MGFVPRDVVAAKAVARRACDPAAPDVNGSSIIANFCNQTLANNFNQCSEQMTVSMQKSAAKTCNQYSDRLTDCLTANKNDSTACSDSLFGYRDCKVYTMQAYAYCGCYYTLPKSIIDCANEQLQPQPQPQTQSQTQPPGIAAIPTTSTPLNTTPTSSAILASDVRADTEPTPPIPTAIEAPASASASSQNPLPFSESPTSTAPSSFGNNNNPGSDTIWAPDATPSTTTGILQPAPTTTVTATYTTTVYTASSSAAVVSTVYTCGDLPLLPTPMSPASARNASAVCADCRRGRRRSKIFR